MILEDRSITVDFTRRFAGSGFGIGAGRRFGGDAETRWLLYEVASIGHVSTTLEGDILAPVVLGQALSLHPLAILLALTAGTIVAGIRA